MGTRIGHGLSVEPGKAATGSLQGGTHMSDELITLISRRFIQRRDVKAQQSSNGIWTPVREGQPSVDVPWRKSDLVAHLAGEKSFGHYMLDTDSNCKLFAFDLDLTKTGHWIESPTPPWDQDSAYDGDKIREFNPREAWLDRGHPARPFLKYQMRMLSNQLAMAIKDLLDIPCAMTFTGYKGVHVYGFTGSVPAKDARDAATIVLDSLGCWEPSRGKAFYSHTSTTPSDCYENFSLEVFPKQDTLDGKDYGNLMRLPLGRNLKAPNNPTFFIDSSAAYNELRPHPEPAKLLDTGNPWL
jgi:hypothetical protein